MDMAVGEAGQHQPALGVNHLGRRSTIYCDVFRTAYRKDLVSADSQRLCSRLCRVHRVDARVDHHHIRYPPRRSLPCGASAQAEQHRQQKQSARRDMEVCRFGQSHSLFAVRPRTRSLKGRRSVHPQHPGLGATRISPAMGRSALEIETVTGFEPVFICFH